MEYKVIDEAEVPASREKCDWNELFSKVLKGKAIVITDIHRQTVKCALKRRQKKGLFKNLIVIGREKTVYVVNPQKLEVKT